MKYLIRTLYMTYKILIPIAIIIEILLLIITAPFYPLYFIITGKDLFDIWYKVIIKYSNLNKVLKNKCETL